MMADWTLSTEAWIWMGAWALVMLLGVWLVVREPHRDAPPDPAAILRERYARGEISESELHHALDTLDDHRGGSRPRVNHGQEAPRD